MSADQWEQNIQTIANNTANIGVMSATNPLIDQDQIRAFIQSGQGFSASTGKQTSGGAIQVGVCLFANNIAKNVLIYSVRVGVASSSLHQINLVTTDPAISGVTFAASNSKPGGNSSLVTLEAQNTAVTTSGNIHDTVYDLANTMVEFLGNNEFIVLPANTVNGILVLINTSTNAWMCDIKWIEY